MLNQPLAGEYAPFYQNYINKAVEAANCDVLQLLTQLKDSTYQFFHNIPAEKADFAYAEGKWTIKELLGHIIDAERVFAYRVLCISRKEQQNLPGFDENEFVTNSNFRRRTINDLAQEFKSVRESNLHMLWALTDDQTALTGTANGSPVSVRALAYIMAGHELHHLNIIRERYL
jgi:uncharacterized damage-inducible protein DinB